MEIETNPTDIARNLETTFDIISNIEKTIKEGNDNGYRNRPQGYENAKQIEKVSIKNFATAFDDFFAEAHRLQENKLNHKLDLLKEKVRIFDDISKGKIIANIQNSDYGVRVNLINEIEQLITDTEVLYEWIILRSLINIEDNLRHLVVAKLKKEIEEDTHLVKKIAERNLSIEEGLSLENCRILIEDNKKTFREAVGWEETTYKKFVGDLAQLIDYRNKIDHGRKSEENIYGEDLPSVINFLKSKLPTIQRI
jgi:hypothetical protein